MKKRMIAETVEMFLQVLAVCMAIAIGAVIVSTVYFWAKNAFNG